VNLGIWEGVSSYPPNVHIELNAALEDSIAAGVVRDMIDKFFSGCLLSY